MRRWISFAFFGLFAVSGWADNPPPLTCTANVPNVPILRPEGVTELVGDILLTCTGGTPTPAGQTIPAATVTASLNAQVTSRLVNPSGQSEALLLIDEPGSSANPSPINFCTNLAGCPITALGAGQNSFNGSASHPNAFLGTVSGNSIVWNGVPIDGSSSKGETIRFTNIRVSAAGKTGAEYAAEFKAIFNDGTAIPIKNGQTPNYPDNPVNVAFMAPPGTSIQPGYGPITATVNQMPVTIYAGAQEGFISAWKPISQDSTVDNPSLVLPQTSVDYSAPDYIFESGRVFQLPGNNTLIGAADRGTTIQLSVNAFPGATALIPAQVDLAGGATMVWNAPNAVTSGSNISIPADAQGNILASGLVAQAPPILPTGPRGFVMPITISGTPSQLPVNIQASYSFYSPGIPAPNTLVFSDLSPGIPAFDETNLDGTPAVYADIIGSIVNSTSVTSPLEYSVDGVLSGPVSSLQVTSNSSPVPFPSDVYNLDLFTAGAPISGLTVTESPSVPWLKVQLNQNTTPASATLNFLSPSTPGNYSTSLIISAPGLPTPLTIPVNSYNFSRPWFDQYDFTNAASNVGNAVAPGEMFTINGYNFGPKTIAASNPSSGKAPTTLAKTQVLFDGTPVPLYSVQNTSTGSFVTGFAPFELSGKTTTQVQVVYNGVKSPPVTLNVLDAVPGIFTVNSNGTGQGMILNSDNSVNSDSNRAVRGSIVTLLATGTGLLTPPGGDGAITGSPDPKLSLRVKVYVDGVVVPSSARAELKNYDEILAIKVRIPATAPANADLPVMLEVGDKVSQPGVTVAVK